MPARLFSQWGETRGLAKTFDEELTIGRRESNSLELDYAAVSGEHARIYFDEAEGCYLVEDLGSLNGTKVDGMRVERPMRLDRLHVLKFGRVCEFVFQPVVEPAVEQPPSVKVEEITLETELTSGPAIDEPPTRPLPEA